MLADVPVAVVRERTFRGPGCSDSCQVVKAFMPGVLGRSELLLHEPEAHERYGLLLGSHGDGVADTVETGLLSVNLATFDVSVDGQPVSLTATETKVTLYLARRVGQTCSRDEVVTAVWGSHARLGRSEDSHLLGVNVCRLRHKLGPAGALIVTMVGRGYRLLSVAPGEAAPPSGLVGRLLGVWSRSWAVCRGCGTTKQRHHWRGYCGRVACRALAAAEAHQERMDRVDVD